MKWIQNSNEIFILRGPFEGKKAEYIKELKYIGTNKFVDGVNLVDDVVNYLTDCYKHIFVDVASPHADTVVPYLNIAKSNYLMAICPSFKDNSTAETPSIAMDDNGNDPLGVIFAGWFLSDAEQGTLHKTGHQCMAELWSNESVRQQMSSRIGTSDYETYYPAQLKRLHVTAKFIGGDADSDYVARTSSSVCSVTKVTVTGILLTPRTFSCHVILPEKVRSLFYDDGDPDMFVLKPHVTLAVGGDWKAVQSGPDQVEVQRMIRDGVPPRAEFRTALGLAADYGECRFYVTLDVAVTVDGLFNYVFV